MHCACRGCERTQTACRLRQDLELKRELNSRLRCFVLSQAEVDLAGQAGVAIVRGRQDSLESRLSTQDQVLVDNDIVMLCKSAAENEVHSRHALLRSCPLPKPRTALRCVRL